MSYAPLISGLDSHSSLIQLAALGENTSIAKEKKRSYAKQALRGSGFSQLSVALSCIGSMYWNADTSDCIANLVLQMLDNTQVVRAISLFLKNTDVISVAKILFEKSVLSGEDLLLLARIRIILLSKTSSENSSVEIFQKLMFELMLAKDLFDIALQGMTEWGPSKERFFEMSKMLLDASLRIEDHLYIPFVQRLSPESMSYDVSGFHAMLQRLVRIEMDKITIPHAVLYEKILPALQLCKDDLSVGRNSSIPYKVFHILQAVEPRWLERATLYKILESTPSFNINEIDGEVEISQLPSKTMILQNLPYAFKCFFYLQSIYQNRSKIILNMLKNFLLTYKQNRLVVETFYSSLSSFILGSSNSQLNFEPKIEPLISMLLESNLVDFSQLARIIYASLSRSDSCKTNPIIEAVNCILVHAGVRRQAFEEFPKRHLMLMAPATFLIYTSASKWNGRMCYQILTRRSILRYFTESGFQMYFNIAVEFLRHYIVAARETEERGQPSLSYDLLSVLSNLLLLPDAISSHEKVSGRFDKTNIQRLATERHTLGKSKTMERLCIVDHTMEDHTPEDLKALFESGHGLDLEWIREAFTHAFGLPEEESSTCIRKVFREFTIYSTGWVDKEFTNSKVIQSLHHESDEVKTYVESDKALQKEIYGKHLAAKYSQEDCTSLFRKIGFHRVCYSFSDAVATFYFFFHHIPLKTYTLMAIDLIDDLIPLNTSKARNVVLFLRCTLDAFSKSQTPSVRSEFGVVMGKYSMKIIQLIGDTSLSLEATINILTLIRETIEYICLSSQCKDSVVGAITEQVEKDPQSAFGVLKGCFENFQSTTTEKTQEDSTVGIKRYRDERLHQSYSYSDRNSNRWHNRDRDRY